MSYLLVANTVTMVIVVLHVRLAMKCCLLNRSSGRSLGHEYGPGEGIIWMDDIHCSGSEYNLADCEHSGWGEHNCRHREDVSISCPNGKNNHSNSIFA